MTRKVRGNRIEEYNGIYYYHNEIGNIIQKEYPDCVIQNYYYDTENQLEKTETFEKDGNSWYKEIWVYAYDPFGRRLSKTCRYPKDKKRSIRYVWEGNRLLQEYMHNAVYTYIYSDQNFYIPSAQHARYLDTEGVIHEKRHYFHCNQAGMPYEMTDKLGNLTWYGSYTALGQIESERRIDPYVHQPFRLQGQYHDIETGLYYNRFRYYDPHCGRFLTQDPIGLDGGMNPYTYAPNTQMWTDPLGLATLKINGRIIRVHANDVDPFPSMPHGHVYDENLVVDKDGKIYRAGKCHSTSDSIGSLSKKEIKIWQKWLKQQGYDLGS